MAGPARLGSMIRRNRLLLSIALALALLAGLSVRAPAAEPIPMQLESISVPVEVSSGVVGRGYISIFLEVPDEKSVARLCELIPKVQDAISLTFEGHPVRSVDGTYDLAGHARRLRQRLNDSLGGGIVVRLFLRQGISAMASSHELRQVMGTNRGCRALKTLPWEAHMPKADRVIPKPKPAGPAIVVGQPQMGAGGDEGGGLLAQLLTPIGLFVMVAVGGFLMLAGGAVGWYVARWRRERRRRQRRGADRRGKDRRQGRGGYTGPERRQGDRRQGDRRTEERREGEEEAPEAGSIAEVIAGADENAD